MQVLAFMIWLVVVEAIYNTSLFSFSATQTSSTVLFNSGDGQAIGLDASLASNSYRTSTPKKATERIATSIAPALCNYLWIHTYITDPDGIVWRRTYGAVEYGWTDDWISSTEAGVSNLASSQGPVDTSSIYTATKTIGGSMLQSYLQLSLVRIIEICWRTTHYSQDPYTDLDVWGISNTGRLYRRSFTGDISSGTWSDWEDLGIYNSLTKPATHIHSSFTALKTGWYPSKTTWSPSLYTNWLSPPTISVYNDGTTRGSDVHVCGN
ncbi:hypothetical protein EYC84_002134 [Monilinia fructicola]|uniref:GH16 domain-containing protein n=1 Tax=Monilinia fructicola TaxID=38448 RepID=A0A5M9JSK0_MONFR|nr:hypothetical protein EYC84_002134 [Monilinia fructicola]